MGAVAERRVSYAEFLALEARSEQRHEFAAGIVFAMAGGTIEHGRIIARLVGLLGGALAGKPCVALASDVRVRIRAADRASYPDVLVVCGTIERDDGDEQAVVNPTVIIEVTSDSTESLDRHEKLADYRRLPSLREYVLVSQRERRVEVYRRVAPRRWSLDEQGTGESVTLTSVDAVMAVDDVYTDALGSIVG
jgi:Uma2 family endonuclease